MRARIVSLGLLLLLPFAARAQETVFFEDLTFDEIRDRIQGGARNVIIATVMGRAVPERRR
jgi:hypothetical protein